METDIATIAMGLPDEYLQTLHDTVTDYLHRLSIMVDGIGTALAIPDDVTTTPLYRLLHDVASAAHISRFAERSEFLQAIQPEGVRTTVWKALRLLSVNMATAANVSAHSGQPLVAPIGILRSPIGIILSQAYCATYEKKNILSVQDTYKMFGCDPTNLDKLVNSEKHPNALHQWFPHEERPFPICERRFILDEVAPLQYTWRQRP